MSLSKVLSGCLKCCGFHKALLYLHFLRVIRYIPFFLILILIVSCGGGGGGGNDNSNPDELAPIFIQLFPVNPEISLGTTITINATAIYADNSKADVTEQVVWSLVNNSGVAFISNEAVNKGQAHGLSVGRAVVVARLSGKQASTTIIVNEAQLLSLELSARDIQIPSGTKKTISARGRYSNNTTQDVTSLVTWTIADPTTAIVTPGEVAIVNGVAIGNTELQAALGGISTSVAVSVTNAFLQTLTIEPFQPRLSVGAHSMLQVLAGFSDGSVENVSDQVSWASSNTAIANVSNEADTIGKVTAISTGSVTLSATLQGVSADTVLVVSDAVLQSITVSPSSVSLAKGTTQRLFATGLYSDNSVKDITSRVVWRASNLNAIDVANVAGAEGLITALETGVSQVIASLDDQSGSINAVVNAAELVSINVTPFAPTIAAGTALQLSAVGNYSDGATQDLTHLVAWDSANTDVATISNSKNSNGSLFAVASGDVIVSANYTGVVGSVTLNVTNAVLTAIEIDQAGFDMAKGTSVSLSATAYFSDASSQDYTHELVWQSSDADVALVSNTGNSQARVLALSAGTTTISAALPGGAAISPDAIVLTVSDAVLSAITVLPQNSSISNNTTLQLSATGHFSDNTEQDVTHQVSWVSSDATLVAISNDAGSYGVASGIITGGADSAVTITARYETAAGLVQGTANLTVSFKPEKPVSLIVNALPNVILNDSVDATDLDIVVRAAAENASVNDGTIVDLEILQGEAVLENTSVSTVGGVATVSLSSAQAGLLVLQATVNGTQVSNTVSLLVVSSFEETIVGISTAIYTIENNIIQAGSKFVFYIVNNSNREFELNKYEFLNNNIVVGVPETNPANLNNNRLPGGAIIGVVANLSGDLVNNGTGSRFTLADTATGQVFTLSTSYNLVP
ncbi:MAG: hypothetical protein GXP08_01680 [Gammaproteobacteria bacterium]|nr:hypothetical protein [Gammaproteobacteria bacterium]